MATVIRFARHGTKKKPFFRIVVQDHTAPRDGRFIDHIGSFDPIKGDNSLVIERERLHYWLSTGAQLSTSVKNRLKLKKEELAINVATSSSTESVGSKTPKPKAKKAKKTSPKVSEDKEA